MKCLVLDAMGVIFRSADDVGELLIPFIAEKAGSLDEAVIQSMYLQASLGKISADEFWNKVGLTPSLEDEYLARHSLTPGILELLNEARDRKMPVWCLSNDVGRWSDKLRSNLGIEEFLSGSVISGDAGVRKPDADIYKALIQACGCRVEDLLFVDDRQKNVIAAREAGIRTILFKPANGFSDVRKWILQQLP